jgi:hypothetical protein
VARPRGESTLAQIRPVSSMINTINSTIPPTLIP